MANRDLLVCAYGFPPVAGPTERRCAEFVRFLSGRGWTIDVLTIRLSPRYYRYDAGDTRLIPPDVRVYRTYPGLFHDYMGFNARAGSIPSNASPVRSIRRLPATFARECYNRLIRPLAVPDRAIQWAPFALATARHLLTQNQYKAIMSSSSPHTSHVVASFVHRWSGAPWIGDWSDPLAFNPNLQHSHFQRTWNRRIEAYLLRAMDKVIVSTEETRRAYFEHYPFLSPDKVTVIPYGFSEEAFGDTAAKVSDRFRIVYTGVFLKTIRRPYAFFDALHRVSDLPIEVIIAGNMEPEYLDYARRSGLSAVVQFLGLQPHSTVVALQKGASALLLVGNAGALQLPGKIFEYFAAMRPILAIQNASLDIAANMVRQHNRGLVVPNDPDHIAQAIRELYHQWCCGSIERNFHLQPLTEYSWSALGQRLEAVIARQCA